uniref:non-specific serine/threonine protein kinase n=1 Tax=Sinocyclocheilus grahami TaxID=75366 RepID=A0A672R4T7_SINGR
MSRRSWIQATFCKRECVKFLPASRDHHRCYPVCQVCQSLVRCCCGRLIAEHVGPYSGLLGHGPGPDSTDEEEWSVLRHTSVSPTDAFGSLDFQASTKRTCRAKYVRLSSDTPPELLVQLMLREWHMEMPKLVISVHGGTESFPLSPRVYQAFSTGLVTAAESTGAWILTDGINTGVSKYVGDAVKVYGSHDHRKRNVVGIPPWGIIENNSDLIGRDVLRHYQALGNPLSKRASLNGMHSHFLLVDDGTMGKSGCQIDLRKRLERHIHFQKIHPRLPEHVPLVCVVVEGGPAILSVVLEHVRRSSPVPVLVFEGTGRAADLLALIHKQTAEDVLLRIQEMFGVERQEASELLNILMECMEHRELITIFDSESEDLQEADAAILTTSLRGTRASPEEQLNITLAWDRADVAKDNILVYGQQWQVGSLEQTMLDALLMDRVSFVKLLIENGMTMSRFLTISRLEQLYNIVMTIYHLHEAFVSDIIISLQIHSQSFHLLKTPRIVSLQEGAVAPQDVKSTPSPEFVCTFNDLFVWAVLKHRQEMAMFLWQHGEQAMARAVVACKLYRAMAVEAKESNMGDSMAEELKKNSLEFGQLAVDLLDQAFRKNERMAMKLLTWEMKDWSNFTCLQMAVSSRLRPFVAHNCTQMLLTDLWMGRLNMSKNSWFKIIASILMPVAIQMLEFKSQAEMSHVPQPQEALQFGWDPGNPGSSEQEGTTNERGSRCLSPWTRKVYDFYTAPVVKFWFHTMAFLGFLMMFSYTVLVRLDEKPNIQECLVITYILTMAAEKAREVSALKITKLKVWFSEYWNINDFMGILLFLVGVSLRWHQETRLASHIVYSLDFIFWSVRLLDLFAVNQHAGPYLTMITKMMSNMFYIVVIMAIVLVSFGTSRKSILSPNEDPSWSLLRDVVFQPYWMIFGEVYAGEIDACSNPETCVPGAFLTPFLQAVYLFVQYIIMVNVLIAFFNNVYFDMSSISRKLWKYNRYRYIMTYQEKPWLPPPLILLSHMTLCLSSMWQKHRKASKRGRTDMHLNFRLKLFGLPEINGMNSSWSSVFVSRAEEMAGILVEVAEKVSIIQDNMRTLDSHLGQLQDLSALAVDTLNFLSATDNQQQEVARLGQSQPITCRHEQVSHSCCLHIGGSFTYNASFFPVCETFDGLSVMTSPQNTVTPGHYLHKCPPLYSGGVEVCIYTLEETEAGSSLGNQSSSISTWIQHGRTAVLQPLAHQEVLDGGLRRATKVVCTWAEGDVLKLGSVYVVKAFRPEVVRIWQKVFPISTSFHLCLREIQQQRAAQKLMQRFNQIKPSSVPYSPRFLDVSLLHWRSDGQWLTVEKNMSGHFRKYNNNTGEEISPSSGLEEAMLAFSHWTFEYTNRELLVLDLQGVGADLTDPSLIRVDDKSSSEEMAFGPANLGDDAIQSFVIKHTCNSCCKKLGLSGEVTLMSQVEG